MNIQPSLNAVLFPRGSAGGVGEASNSATEATANSPSTTAAAGTEGQSEPAVSNPATTTSQAAAPTSTGLA